MEHRIFTQPALQCPLCHQEGVFAYKSLTDRLYYVPGHWNFLRCTKCHLLWLDPRPVAEDIPKCYPENYFTHLAPPSISVGSSDLKRRLRLLCLAVCFGYPTNSNPNKVIRWLIQALMLIPSFRDRATMNLGPMLLPYRDKGRILDVGCGDGVYLALMKELGWEVAGVEIDQKAADIARAHFSIPIHVGSLFDAPFPEESFDAVTMSHVIEHVEDPVGFIAQASRYLKHGGRLIIITPNAASLGARLFGKDWYALDPPRHLMLFTSKSLKLSIERTKVFAYTEIFSLDRKAQKIFRKFILMRRIGQFCHPREEKLSKDWRVRLGAWCFEKLEQFGSPVFRWGEEIACIAVKA